MDTFEITARAVARLKLSAKPDPLRARIEIALEEQGERYLVVLQVEPNRVRLRAHRMAGTGGPDGEFDLPLAGLVARLAYDLDLHIGMDQVDGEVEARRVVDLTHVPERARSAAVTWAVRSFLDDHGLALRCLLAARDAVLSRKVLADPTLRLSA